MSENVTPEQGSARSNGCVIAIAVVGGLVTIITGGLKILEYSESLSSKVTAQVSLSPFSLPPSVLQEREKIRDTIQTSDTVQKAIDLTPCGDAGHRREIAWSIINYFRNIVPYAGMEELTGQTNMWLATVTNRGNSTCESVTLTLPGATSASVEREGHAIQYVDVKEVVELGDFRPRESVKVTAWVRGFVDEDKLKLVHKTGVGSIQALKPLGPAWQFLAEEWDGFVAMIFMSLFIGVLVVVVQRIRRSRS